MKNRLTDASHDGRDAELLPLPHVRLDGGEGGGAGEGEHHGTKGLQPFYC